MNISRKKETQKNSKQIICCLNGRASEYTNRKNFQGKKNMIVINYDLM